ncbi:MAG: hypothetical protein ABJB01_07690 [Rudaea sp.]
MNPTRYGRQFYSTPHYAHGEHTPPIFAVKALHVQHRQFHSRGHVAGGRYRMGASPSHRATDPVVKPAG